MAKHTGKIIGAGVAVALVGISAPGFINGAARYGTPMPDLGAAYDSGKTCGTFAANVSMNPFVHSNGTVAVTDITSDYDKARCQDDYDGMFDAGEVFGLSLRTGDTALDMPGAFVYGVWNAALAGVEDFSLSLGYEAGKSDVRDQLLKTRPENIPAEDRLDQAAPQ